MAVGGVTASVIAILFAGLLVGLAHFNEVPGAVPAFYLTASAVAILMYALDKSAARRGRWRTSELTLHLLGLAGGWPGAMVAQRFLRHKSRKMSFQIGFWITVLLNCLALYALTTSEGSVLLQSFLDEMR